MKFFVYFICVLISFSISEIYQYKYHIGFVGGIILSAILGFSVSWTIIDIWERFFN